MFSRMWTNPTTQPSVTAAPYAGVRIPNNNKIKIKPTTYKAQVNYTWLLTHLSDNAKQQLFRAKGWTLLRSYRIPYVVSVLRSVYFVLKSIYMLRRWMLTKSPNIPFMTNIPFIFSKSILWVNISCWHIYFPVLFHKKLLSE